MNTTPRPKRHTTPVPRSAATAARRAYDICPTLAGLSTLCRSGLPLDEAITHLPHIGGQRLDHVLHDVLRYRDATGETLANSLWHAALAVEPELLAILGELARLVQGDVGGAQLADALGALSSIAAKGDALTPAAVHADVAV